MTTKNYPIRFVGSLAYSYAAILREVAREFGIELEIIEETPMNGLIEFPFFKYRRTLNSLYNKVYNFLFANV